MSILLLPGRQQCNASPLRLVLLTVPSLFIFLGHPLRFKSDHVVGAGYSERELVKQCPACVPVPPYHPFPLSEGQDSSSALGVPQQRGFRHVSCSPYHGSGLVSWRLTPVEAHPYLSCPYHFCWPSAPESWLSQGTSLGVHTQRSAPLGPGCGVCSSDLEPREDRRLDPCSASVTGHVNETWDVSEVQQT